MPINADYRGPGDLPEVIPVFPLPGALLLPRGQMPLNIFEPRYLAMVDDALRDGHRLIGMIQPDVSHSRDEAKPALFRVGCVGRITQLAEAGDGRYILELTGIARFKVVEEMTALTAYRQCKVDYFPFIDDFTARKGEEEVDREALLEVLTDFLKANNLKVDWEGVESAPERSAGQRAGDDVALRAAGKAGDAGGARSEDPRRDSDRRHRNGPRQEAHQRRSAAAVAFFAIEPGCAPWRKRRSPEMIGTRFSGFARAGTTASSGDQRMTSPPERLEGTVDPKLLEILVCPMTKGPLEFDAARQELISRSAKLAYPIRDGIPIMLPEEARKID